MHDPLLLTSPMTSDADWVSLLAKYGIPALIVFAAGVLLPMAFQQARKLGIFGKTILAAAWVLVLAAAVVFLYLRVRQELRTRYVVDGSITGIEHPEQLEFDDPNVFKRHVQDEQGRVRYEWVYVTPHPPGDWGLTIRVVGPDGLHAGPFRATGRRDTFKLKYDGAKRKIFDVDTSPAVALPLDADLRSSEVPPIRLVSLGKGR